MPHCWYCNTNAVYKMTKFPYQLLITTLILKHLRKRTNSLLCNETFWLAFNVVFNICQMFCIISLNTIDKKCQICLKRTFYNVTMKNPMSIFIGSLKLCLLSLPSFLSDIIWTWFELHRLKSMNNTFIIWFFNDSRQFSS